VLQLASRLDQSATTTYSLCIDASDGKHSSSVVFNVSLYQPTSHDLVQFSLPFYVFDILEDATLGVVVGRVEASVGVVGHPSSSSRLSYIIMSRWASSTFQINATYGLLTLASRLDYETVSHYC